MVRAHDARSSPPCGPCGSGLWSACLFALHTRRNVTPAPRGRRSHQMVAVLLASEAASRARRQAAAASTEIIVRAPTFISWGPCPSATSLWKKASLMPPCRRQKSGTEYAPTTSVWRLGGPRGFLSPLLCLPFFARCCGSTVTRPAAAASTAGSFGRLVLDDSMVLVSGITRSVGLYARTWRADRQAPKGILKSYFAGSKIPLARRARSRRA